MTLHTPPPQAHEREPTNTQTDKTPPRPSVQIDFEYYERYLTDYDMTPEQKHELIATLANILVAFIDLGFGVAPGQIPYKDDEISLDFSAENGGNLLYSEDISTPVFETSAEANSSAEGDDS